MDDMKKVVSLSLALFIFGAVVAGLIIYLTPLKNKNLIAPTVHKIDPEEFYRDSIENPEKYFLVDIRPPELVPLEYPENSVSIPLVLLANEIDKLPRDRTIVIFCQLVSSEIVAYQMLEHNGFTNLLIIDGALPSWKAVRLPLLQGEAEAVRELAEKIKKLKQDFRAAVGGIEG